ncbi:MAG: hypothetical protein ACLPVY_02185 [Acidimicrobiia bacterium]
MIQPGEPWGSPTSSPPDVEVAGGDAALAAVVGRAPGALVRFRPDRTSDLARAVGLAPTTVHGPATALGTALPLDLLAFSDAVACNMCVFGTPPDRLGRSSPSFEIDVELDGRPWHSGRATTVVVAIGQFLRGLDVVPRGHPGDGKAEVQVYDLARRERRMMRSRLVSGAHLPHPRIRQRSAHAIQMRFRPAAPAEVDGVGSVGLTDDTTIEVVANAYRLLV